MATTILNAQDDFDSAVTALDTLVTDVYDVTNGLLRDEGTASAYADDATRAVLAELGTRASAALEALTSHDFEHALDNAGLS